MRKRVLTMTLLVLLLAALLCSAQAESGECGANLTWSLFDGTLTISGSGAMYDYNDFYAPWYEKDVTKVIIGSDVSSIGMYAFEACYYLEHITIPGSVKLIDEYAFEDCDSLKTVVYEGSAQQYYNLDIEDHNEYLENAYWDFTVKSGKCGADLTWNYDGTGILTIAGTGTMIDYSGDNGKYPPWEYFRNEITDVIIESGVTSIGSCAFQGLEVLETVMLPGSMNKIGENAFKDCDELWNVYYNGKPEQAENIMIEDGNDCLFDLEYWNCCSIDSGKCGEDLTFSISGTTLTITGTGAMDNYYDGNDEDTSFYPPWEDVLIYSVVIEPGVTTIGDNAFYYNEELRNITIPNDVTTIGEYAFSDCSLKSIAIPNGVITIGEYAFNDCYLNDITIPDSVTTIGDGAFEGNRDLKTVNLGKGIKSIGADAFFGCFSLENVMYTGTLADKKKITIDSRGNTRFIELLFGELPEEYMTCGENLKWHLADGILTISGTGMMYDYTESSEYDDDSNPIYYGNSPWYDFGSEIKSVVVDPGVTSIGSDAFCRLTSLVSINLPDGIISIGGSAFWCCTCLESVILPTSVETIGHWAFYNCTSLMSINISRGLVYIGVAAFNGCTSLENIDIPESVVEIGGSAFRDCSSLAHITLPSGLTSIQYCSFEGCSSLKSITIPNGVTYIEENAFLDCASLAHITLPSGLTSIQYRSFEGCSSLKSITIPNGVTNIGDFAFDSCISLASITLPASVTSIGYGTFDGCDSIEKVLYSGTREQRDHIDIDAWNYPLIDATWYYLPSSGLSLPSSLKVLNADALRNTKAQRIDVPESVEVIGSGAFAGCADLVALVFEGDPTSIASDALQGCSGLTIYVHAGGTAEAWARTTGFTVVTM